MDRHNARYWNQISRLWSQFTQGNSISKGIINDEILDSWKRSKSYNVNPMSGKGSRALSEQQFNAVLEEKSLLISIVDPVLETLYRFVKDDGFVALFADNNALILRMINNEETRAMVEEYNYLPGANWSESEVGTNGISTSLFMNRALQVSGAEHYCYLHHPATCSAAPVHDPSGKLIGVICLTGLREKVHLHTLGMCVSAAAAIENHLSGEILRKQLQLNYEQLRIVMDSFTEGIMSVDKWGQITNANSTASLLLGLNVHETKGLQINQVAQKQFTSLFEQKKECRQVDIIFQLRGNPVHLSVSTSPIQTETTNFEGMVFAFQPVKNVRRMVQRYTGANASFVMSDIIGQSQEFKDTLRLASLAGTNSATVLILGESGTGKEVIAQAIHNASSRRLEPFVAISCSAIPRELIGSELFGYAEGAFTGAKKGGHPGKFELADGGTLFLDEIGDMPLEMQAYLLRVLQERKVVRIGGTKEIPVDVRVISATNKNLPIEVQHGNFRADLYYRLNVLTIPIVPLRERKTDITLLFWYFAERIARNLGKTGIDIEPEAMSAVMQYDWPGNVRELQNCVERAITILDGNTLKLEHFSQLLRPATIKNQARVVPEPMSLKNLARAEIQNILNLNEGNVTKSAEFLGISRNTLYRKIKQFDLDLPGRQD